MKKISDKDIEKLNACITRNNYPDWVPVILTLDKALIKKAGYRVETDKTKLEEARDYECGCTIVHNGENYCKNEDRLKQMELYEKAISESQTEKCCDNCIYGGEGSLNCWTKVDNCYDYDKWELKK